jgi:hypothetical protein
MGKRRAATGRSKATPRRYRSAGLRPASRTDDPELRRLARRTAATAAELVELESPHLVERWLSNFVAMWDCLYLMDEDADTVIGLRVVEAAAVDESPRALTLLTGLAVFGGSRVAARARSAASRLAGYRDQAPEWLDALGRARVLGAWRTQEPFGDGEMVALALQHDGYPRHAVGVLIDHNLGSMAKDAVFQEDAHGLRAIWEHEVPEVTTTDIDIQEAGDVLANGLEVERMFSPSPATEDLRNLRPLLRTYLRAFPAPREVQRPTLDERERDRLAEEFAASDEARGLDPEVVDDLAWRAVHFGCDYSDGDPLRWSPVVVELFMADWLPRKALLESPIEKVPEVLRAWVRFAGRRRGMPEDLIQDAVAAVADWEGEFMSAMKDSRRFGPSKAIVEAMLDEGIEISDKAAVDAWVKDFNARSEEERRKVLS